MSAPGWTGGPWRVSAAPYKGERWVEVFGLEYTRDQTTVETDVAQAVGLANAHLIAAAPDLYSALRELAAFVELAVDNGALDAEEMEDNELLAMARTALSKARGEG